LGLAEEGAARDVPAPDERPVHVRAEDLRPPVQLAGDDLTRGAGSRTRVRDGRALGLDRARVVLGEGRNTGGDARASLGDLAGEDHDVVRAERADVRLDRLR